MNTLRQTFFCITTVSVTYSIIKLFGTNNRLKKYTDYAVSLVIILSLISPIKQLLGSDPISKIQLEIPSVNQIEADASYAHIFEQAIKQSIEERLALPSDKYELSLILYSKDGYIYIEKIEAAITDKSYFKYADRLDSYLRSELECEITVIQKERG